MTIPARRHYPRQQTEIGVTVLNNGEKIPATLINMSEGGAAFFSDREMTPGTEVNITLNYIDDYSIHGTIKWAQLHDEVEKKMYCIGIAADLIIPMENIQDESEAGGQNVDDCLDNNENQYGF